MRRRHDVQQYAIVSIEVLSHCFANLIGGHVEEILQVGIEQFRVIVIERKLGQLLCAIQRRLTAACRGIEEIISEFLHLFGARAGGS